MLVAGIPDHVMPERTHPVYLVDRPEAGFVVVIAEHGILSEHSWPSSGWWSAGTSTMALPSLP
jgi:hypothetical protein